MRHLIHLLWPAWALANLRRDVSPPPRPSGDDRTAPNTKFLSRYLEDVERGNKRVIARNAARAAQQAVGASGAAALRPGLHKAAAKGVGAVQKLAMATAEQQKLTLCSALLKEVRMKGLGDKLINAGWRAVFGCICRCRA